MNLPLMPKATAIWLIENTSLTFDQIAEFCGMHPLEVKGIADGEVAPGMIGENPITTNQLTHEEIKRCEQDPKQKLRLIVKHFEVKKKKTSRYTPIARRQDKPDAISWFLKYHPEVSEIHLIKLIGTTKTTIGSIKTRSHWNISNIKPRDPVLLGLCTQIELDKILDRSKISSDQNIEE